MPNGKPGDNPISDLLLHGAHPFPPDMEDLILRLHKLNPNAVGALGWNPFDWEAGKKLNEGRKLLAELLEKNGLPNS